MSARAGAFRGDGGPSKAFVPKPLPPDPPLDVSQEMVAELSHADQSLGRLDGVIQTIPNPDLFVAMYVRHEAVLSSQIEGTQSTLEDLLAVELEPATRGLPEDVEEVVNYVRAMNHGLERLATLPLSLRLIREIHAELLRTGAERTPAGRVSPRRRTGSAQRRAPTGARNVRAAARATRCTTRSATSRRFLHDDDEPPGPDPRRPRARAVRDHPPVPRRQRPRRAAADHLPARASRVSCVGRCSTSATT